VHELFDLDDDTVARFLARWYGPPERAGGVPVAARGLPAPLRDWYAAAGRYAAPVTFHNTVLDPDEVEEDDGKCVFWVENQAVYEWAFDPGDDDPLVYERSTGDGEPWYPTGVRLSAFLVGVTVFEAVMGAGHRVDADGLTAGQLGAVLAPLRPLPLPGPTVDAQLYAGDGVLAFAGAGWVHVAATDPDRLRHARDAVRPATP
jgi:hypothetical protein